MRRVPESFSNRINRFNQVTAEFVRSPTFKMSFIFTPLKLDVLLINSFGARRYRVLEKRNWRGLHFLLQWRREVNFAYHPPFVFNKDRRMLSKFQKMN